MGLAVVTVNYCCAGEILSRLESTAAQIENAGGEWWLVDNKSPDNSADLLEAAVAKVPHTHLIRAERNGGFGYGNNQIINRVLSGEIAADYIYFLNPDASPEPGAIEAMMSYLDDHAAVGVVGSGLINEDGSHTASFFRFPSFWSEIDQALEFGPVSRLLRGYRVPLGAPNGAIAVDWVAGTSFMARSDVFRAVGGFDEDFFLYWEEVELCHRIKRAGFEIHGLPSAKVRHLGGASTGMHVRERRIPDYWHRSRNLYFRKTRTGGPLGLLNLATALSLATSRCLEALKGASPRHPRFLRDHIRHALD
ncbi:MAG TPA: glycosyltransferase family 2 protein [Acidobacteriaceae bacterium]|nr:glycosyltransferase family 2 protein [Acidobacteriaceae bacterium]